MRPAEGPGLAGRVPANRPKVERKTGHLMRRGRPKVAAEFARLAAALNVARFGILGISGSPEGNWVVAPN